MKNLRSFILDAALRAADPVLASLEASIRRSRCRNLARRMKTCGRNFWVVPPYFFLGEEYMEIGDDVHIWSGAKIVALDRYGEDRLSPSILIGNRVTIHNSVNISAGGRMEIGDDVLMGSRVLITDVHHGALDESFDPDARPADRPLKIEPVKIGNRIWLCERSAILPGVTVGDGAVVGANAVVTHDVPPGTMVAGVPARIVKKYDHERHRWIRANEVNNGSR